MQYSNIKSYFFKEYSAITTYSYGRHEKFDFILLCQHGYEDKTFRKKFLEKEIDKIYKKHGFLFEEFLDFELDSGARLLSFNIAEQLSEVFSVLLVHVNCDRGIMDANRVQEICVNKYISELVSRETTIRLKLLNQYIRETILNIFNNLSTDRLFILDVHSMWPFNIKSINPIIDISLEKFIELLRISNDLSNKRNINLIVRDNNNLVISDINAANSIMAGLKNNGYNVDIDKPFYMSDVRSNYHYFKRYKGLAIDIPRDLLGDFTFDNLNFSFMNINTKKIKEISIILAESLKNFQYLS